MELRELLRRRRMRRNYLPDPVSGEALLRVASAGLRAPSAGFSQGQALVVVTDPHRRAEIARLADEDEYVARGFDPWISGAPAHIVVCVSEDAYHRRYREPDKTGPEGEEIEWPVPYWWVDAGATLMLVLLAAADEGLAAGFIGTHALPGLRALLDIPSEYAPIGVVTIGYPASDRRSGSLDRGWRPQAETIHWERWGGDPPA